MKHYFKPEFLNRVDEIIVFHPLGAQTYAENLRTAFKTICSKGKMDTAGIELTWSEKTINYLAEKGYDPSFGARPVKRLIQQEYRNSPESQDYTGDKARCKYKLR
jgi:ATP-dependent Clp protease ATP-binding subunit ClpB